MKTQLSSLDICFLARELSELAGARIDKIYQIGERDIKLSLRATGGKKELIITPTYMCLTKFEHEAPGRPSNLAMRLRKLLGGCKIDSIRQHRFDRIVEIEIGKRGRLVLELFSRGNVIMLDEKGVITALLESQEWKDRTLKPGMEYVYPPETPDIKTMPLKEFSVAMAERKEMVKILASNLGLGSTYANEVLERAGIGPDARATKELVERSYTILKKMLESPIAASIVYDEGAVDAVPFDMVVYKGKEKERKPSFNEAVDEYFTKLRTEGEKKEATKDYGQDIKSVERRIEKQEKTVKEMGEGAKEFKEKGDRIYARYQEIDALLKGIGEAKGEGKNWVEFLKESGMRVHPAERKFDFEGIPISVDKSVPENAAAYYDKAKKAKSKLAGAKQALRESEKELEALKDKKVKVEKKLPEGPVEKHKPEWYEKFRWFISSDGFLVIGGRDATTNEILIKKHLEPKDLVFHSTVHGAPFFIVKNSEGREVPQPTKQQAAEAAVSYSSAWNAGWGSADVYAVGPEQVSKDAPSGEYLPKGAFMIRGEREWFKGVPLKLALGFRVTDYAIAIGGPEDAVASQAKHYVMIGPGDSKSGKLAKQIKADILRKSNKEDGRKIKKVVLGEIQKWIPAGKGMILK